MTNAIAIRNPNVTARSHPQLIAEQPRAASQLSQHIKYALLLLIMMSAVGTFFRLGVATPLWLASYGAIVVYVFTDFENFSKGLMRAWPAVLFSVLCFCSALWSVEPQATIKNGLQLIFTAIIGVWMGTTFSTRQLFTALSIAMLCCLAASVANIFVELVEPFKEDDYVGAERYFIGLYPQKNLMGNVVYLSALGILYLGIQYRRVLISLVFVAALLPLMMMTKSTTSLLTYLVALSMPVVWWFLSSVQRKGLLLLSLSVGGLLAAFIIFLLDIPLVNNALDALGKDATLTGRTVIWSTGFNSFDKSPFLGVGYQAFWNSSKFLHEVMLIRGAILETINGFHNGHLEVAVGLGMLGLFCYWFMLLSVIIVCLQSLFARPSAATLACTYFVLLTIFRSFVESAVYFQHDLDYLLFCAFMASVVVSGTQKNKKEERASREQYPVSAGARLR